MHASSGGIASNLALVAFNHVSCEKDRIHFLFNREVGGKLQRSRWSQLTRIDAPG